MQTLARTVSPRWSLQCRQWSLQRFFWTSIVKLFRCSSVTQLSSLTPINPSSCFNYIIVTMVKRFVLMSLSDFELWEGRSYRNARTRKTKDERVARANAKWWSPLSTLGYPVVHLSVGWRSDGDRQRHLRHLNLLLVHLNFYLKHGIFSLFSDTTEPSLCAEGADLALPRRQARWPTQRQNDDFSRQKPKYATSQLILAPSQQPSPLKPT